MSGPVTSNASTFARVPAVVAPVAFRYVSKTVLIASASRGVPSWNVTPSRRVSVYSVKSSFGSSDSARYGSMDPSSVRAMSGSIIE